MFFTTPTFPVLFELFPLVVIFGLQFPCTDKSLPSQVLLLGELDLGHVELVSLLLESDCGLVSLHRGPGAGGEISLSCCTVGMLVFSE
jgi:hypothetical protein